MNRPPMPLRNAYKDSISGASIFNHLANNSVSWLTLLVTGTALNTLTHTGFKLFELSSLKRSLTECKYCTYDSQLLTIYSVVKHFRHNLEGQTFTIFTDHYHLTFALSKNSESFSPRQFRHPSFLNFALKFSIYPIKRKQQPRHYLVYNPSTYLL